MRALQILLNDKDLCTAGVGEFGILTAFVTWRFRAGAAGKSKKSRRRRDELCFDVGGLNDLTAEHVDWPRRQLKLGDEIRIRIVEIERVSRPKRRELFDPSLVERSQQKYLENTAKRLGWKIVKRARSRTRD